jgi:hypothetical protein
MLHIIFRVLISVSVSKTTCRPSLCHTNLVYNFVSKVLGFLNGILMTSFPLTGHAGLTHNAVINVRIKGRAVTQAVRHWLLTAVARARAQVSSFGIYGGQSGTGTGFLRVLRFPCQSAFNKLLHNLGLVQYPSSGRSAKRTQSHLNMNNVQKKLLCSRHSFICSCPSILLFLHCIFNSFFPLHFTRPSVFPNKTNHFRADSTIWLVPMSCQ